MGEMKIASLVQSIIAMTLVYTSFTMAMPTSEERKIAGILRDSAHTDRFCNNIATVLEIICNGRGFNEPSSSKEIYNRNKRDVPGIKDECCVRPCGAQTLERYCAGPQEPWNKLTERVSKSLKNVTVDNSINRGLPSPPSPNPKGGRSAPEVKVRRNNNKKPCLDRKIQNRGQGQSIRNAGGSNHNQIERINRSLQGDLGCGDDQKDHGTGNKNRRGKGKRRCRCRKKGKRGRRKRRRRGKTETQYHGPSTSQIGYIPEERTRPIINLPHHKQPPDLSH